MPIPPRAEDYFEQPVIDRLMEICLELGSALWVTRDRLRVMEALLVSKGLLAAEEIEGFDEPAEAVAAGKADRDRFVAQIYGRLKDL